MSNTGKISAWANFSKGIIQENPTLALMLGLCPSLAVSSKAFNGLAMGVAATFVLLGSNIIVSSLRKFIPDKIRIPAYIIIIATFVTIIDYMMKAYLPLLHQNMGIFIQLIVVNCIILGRAEAYANKNTIGDSIVDALGMGAGFTLTLTVISVIREFLGAGQLTYLITSVDYTIDLHWLLKAPAVVFVLPAGAFFTIGFMMPLFNAMRSKRKNDIEFRRAHT